MDNRILTGIIGTIISAVGTSMSANEIQAIVSTIVTVLGFLLGVVLPLVLKLVAKIKKAKEDGVITPDELEDIANTAKEGVKEINESLPKGEEVSEKSEGDQK